MKPLRFRLTVRRCLVAVALVAFLLSRLEVDRVGDIRGVTFRLGCSSVAGAWWNGLSGRYEAIYWPDTWTGRGVVGIGYDPKKHQWIRNPMPAPR
jgi:hypothetical protein